MKSQQNRVFKAGSIDDKMRRYWRQKLSSNEAKYIFFWGLTQWFVFVKVNEGDYSNEVESEIVINGNEE